MTTTSNATTKTCSKCKQNLLIERFYKNKQTQKLYPKCKDCLNKYSHELYLRNAEYRKRMCEYSKQYARSHPEATRRHVDQYAKTHPEAIRAYRKRYAREHPEISARYNRSLRTDVMQAYGGKCTCCGETTIDFLTLDHINNNGAEHRRRVGESSVYTDLRKRGYPQEGYRVLCWNCHMARGTFYGCPHQGATT